MSPTIEVSVIIPTYNRRDLVVRALDSALAQTCPVDEIIVIDDGSSDDTRSVLASRYGERIRYEWQPNAGVSAARNRGMSLAKGRFLALLDSDDEWFPEKTRLQLDWMREHPTYGMVLCDVERVDDDQRLLDVFRRRDVIKEDGWVFRWVIQNPSLVPASALLRREVFEGIGGFDESLRTAEDLDFHLRIAHHWPIGVVEGGPLVRATRGNQGLSGESSTYDDYVRVMEKAVAGARGIVDDRELGRALAATYVRNARGLLICRRWRDAFVLALKAWRHDESGDFRRQLLALIPFAAKRAVRSLLPA
jgi:glycosyltransferase involved in cell wall biosynthesis